MAKKWISAWFFLLLSFGACAQLPQGSFSTPMHHGRHLEISNGAADVAEMPDEHVQERQEEVRHQQ